MIEKLFNAVLIVAVITAIAAFIYSVHKIGGKNEMPAGLQIYDSKKQLILDTSDYTFRQFGQGETGRSDGNIIDSQITADTVVIPYSIALDTETKGSYYYMQVPFFTVSKGEIAWYFPKSSYQYDCKNNVLFIYGEYRK